MITRRRRPAMSRIDAAFIALVAALGLASLVSLAQDFGWRRVAAGVALMVLAQWTFTAIVVGIRHLRE